MEYGDRPKQGGFLGKVKEGLYRRLDPAAKEDEKMEIRESIRTRQGRIKDEQRFRADVRAGKRQGGIRDYLGSVISEGSQKRKIQGLEDRLDPNAKKMRAFERRQKVNRIMGKIERGFDTVGDAYDKAGKYFDDSSGRKKGGGSSVFGGLDIDELAGLKGSRSGAGSPRKGRRKKSGSRREAQDWTDLF